MKRLMLLVVLSALAAPLSALACSCGFVGSFENLVPKYGLVVRAKVVAYGPGRKMQGTMIHPHMDVEILEVIKGEYHQSTLRLIGDDGAECRPYIMPKRFPLGHEMLFVVEASASSPQPLSNCGEYWLPVRDGKVKTCDEWKGGACEVVEVGAFISRIKAQVKVHR